MNHPRLIELLPKVKAFAQEYYTLTGKPLGVTAEIAEVEASRLLGIDLCRARQEGYDALKRTPNGDLKLQIKGVCFPELKESGWRIGSIALQKEWDAIIMVLLRPDLEPRELWEADRAAVMKLLANAPRMDPKVREFKRIGKRVWPGGSTTN